MKISDISKLTGFLICYLSKADMENVHARLKDLKQKESELKDVVLSRAYNPIDGIPYPWTIALLVTDAQKFKCLDDYLTGSNVDLSELNPQVETRIFNMCCGINRFLNGKPIPSNPTTL